MTPEPATGPHRLAGRRDMDDADRRSVVVADRNEH